MSIKIRYKLDTLSLSILCFGVPILALIVLFLGLPLTGFAQPQKYYSIEHFTINEGLPSNELYDIEKDKDGSFWITTDNGLVRYDGYEFYTYSYEKGLTDRVVFDMHLDNQGRIWMNGISGKIFYYSPELDSIIDNPYINQKGFVQAGMKKHYFFDDASNEISFSIYKKNSFDYIIVDPDRKEIKKFINDSKIWPLKNGYFINISEEYIELFDRSNGKNKVILRWDIQKFPFNFDVVNTWIPLGNLGMVVSNPAQTVIVLKDTVQYLIGPRINDIQYLHDSLFYTAYDQEWGVRCYHGVNNFLQNKGEVLLDSVPTSNILVADDGIWVTSQTNGLFHIHKSTYPFAMISTPKIIKVLKFKNKIYSFYQDDYFDVYDFQLKKLKSYSIKPKVVERGAGICRNRIYLSNKIGLFSYLSEDGKTETIIVKPGEENNYLKNLNGKELISSFDDRFLYSNNSSGVIKYNIKTKEARRFDHSRINALLSTYEKKLYAASMLGLFDFTHDKYDDKIQAAHPFLSRRIDFMIQLLDSTIVLASKNEGVYLLKNGKVREYNINDELKLKYIRGVYYDGKNIWINASIGLIVLEYSDGQIIRREIINYFDGLPKTDIIDLFFHENQTFLVYENAILSFPYIQSVSKPNDFSFTPKVASISINGKKIRTIDSLVLGYEENNVTIKLLTFDYIQKDKIKYQYAINSDNFMELGNERELHLFKLSPGQYRIKIRALSSDLNYSQPTILYIKIVVPWWKRWWFYLSLSICITGIVVWYIKYLLNNQKQKNKIKEEIKKLEKSALQAQMNPHFIFNSLNSIQRFILSNEKEEASEYLSKFAFLIRQNLKFSNAEYISLEEEINSLKVYMELEKLRFKNKLEFNFVFKDLDKHGDVLIPPMLIQPILENAVLHGIANSNNFGYIFCSIEVSKNERKVYVKIKDNGVGLQFKKHNATGHESFGRKIIQRRLELINEKFTDYFVLKEEFDEQGNVSGTLATLSIPF